MEILQNLFDIENNMKILHIHTSMGSGGIESMITALANEMAKTEDVYVCSIFKASENDCQWNKLSTNVKKYHLGKVNKGTSLRAVCDVYKYIKANQFDVVYMHGFIQYYVLAVLLCRNIKFCYTVHTDANMENRNAWARRLFQFRKLCFKFGWIVPITISDVSKESFYELYHIEPALIYNGIERYKLQAQSVSIIEQYRYTPQTKIFIHAGRISVPKNQVVLCEVFKRLINDGEDVVLLIAGNVQREDIFDKIQTYFNDRIVYLGVRNDVCELMAHSDAMCLPSIWEGLPVTLLESLSVGCIPICAPVGGIVNVVEQGVNGFLSADSTEESYYQAVKAYLKLSEKEQKAMQQRCYNSFSKYDISETVVKYLQLAR